MKVARELEVAASAEEVWALFWDIPELARCIPGCESAKALEEPGRYAAVIAVQIGRFRVEFELTIELVEVAEGQMIKARAQGTDRRTRSKVVSDLELRVTARRAGGAIVRLENAFQVYGRLGSMGHSIVSRRGEELMDEFARNVSSRLSQGAPAEDSHRGTQGRPPEAAPPAASVPLGGLGRLRAEHRSRIAFAGGGLALLAALVVAAVVIAR